MKKLLLIVLLILAHCSLTFGQTFDWGVSFSPVTIQGSRIEVNDGSTNNISDTLINGVVWDTVRSYEEDIFIYGFYFTGNFPIHKINNESVINMNTGFDLGLAEGNFVFSVPVLFTYKFGTDATLRTKTSFGYAIGGGYKYFGLASNDSWSNHFTPLVYAEINKVFNESNLTKISFSYQFKNKFYKQFDVNPDNVYNGDISMDQSFVITLGYSLSY